MAQALFAITIKCIHKLFQNCQMKGKNEYMQSRAKIHFLQIFFFFFFFFFFFKCLSSTSPNIYLE